MSLYLYSAVTQFTFDGRPLPVLCGTFSEPPVTKPEGRIMKRFIGLDVHKTVVEICMINEAGKILSRRRIDLIGLHLGFGDGLGFHRIADHHQSNKWFQQICNRPGISRHFEGYGIVWSQLLSKFQ